MYQEVEDIIKTNIRISKVMKDDFVELAGDMDLQKKLEELVINYNKRWNVLGFEKMLIESSKYRTKRKVANLDDNKDYTAKDYIITLKTDKRIYDIFKDHCEDIGIVFGEGIRRVLKQAIAEYKTSNS